MIRVTRRAAAIAIVRAVSFAFVFWPVLALAMIGNMPAVLAYLIAVGCTGLFIWAALELMGGNSKGDQ